MATSSLHREALRFAPSHPAKPAPADASPRAEPLPRDMAHFPGPKTREVLAGILRDQLTEGFARDDERGVRRTCALLEAIWPDVPDDLRTDILARIESQPDWADGLLRIVLLQGRADLAAKLVAIPRNVLDQASLLPDDVIEAICLREDFEAAILPAILTATESTKVTFGRLYPAPMPDTVRRALTACVGQSDSRLGDVLAARADGFSADLAADLERLTTNGRLSRLRQAVIGVTSLEAPAESPLLVKITERLAAMSEEGDDVGTLHVLASLLRLPPAAVTKLVSDEDPLLLALGLRGVCLAPELVDVIRGESAWPAHRARHVVESPAGYTIGRRYVADLRRQAV